MGQWPEEPKPWRDDVADGWGPVAPAVITLKFSSLAAPKLKSLLPGCFPPETRVPGADEAHARAQQTNKCVFT